METKAAVQGYVVGDTEGAFASKVCGKCAEKFALENLGVVLDLELETSVSWENENFIVYAIIDGDSESYAVNGYECENGCGAVLDLRPESEESTSWGELAQLIHATQVKKFGWCSCEDNEGQENPYDDCPTGEEGVK